MHLREEDRGKPRQLQVADTLLSHELLGSFHVAFYQVRFHPQLHTKRVGTGRSFRVALY